MQTRTRIVAKLEIKSDFVVKPIYFEGLKKIGKPKLLAEKYQSEGIDEIVINDIVASLYKRKPNLKLLSETINSLSIPICLGGGIRSVDDAINLLNCGADKINLNTAALSENANIIDKIVKILGKQSLVLEIQAKKIRNKWFCLTDNGRINSKKELLNWVKEVESRGAGEIFLQSVDKDGSMKGYDIDLLEKVSSKIKVPLIFSSGCGSIDDIKKILKYNISAICVSSALHYEKVKVKQIKKIL